jgi:hypothetical protein
MAFGEGVNPRLKSAFWRLNQCPKPIPSNWLFLTSAPFLPKNAIYISAVERGVKTISMDALMRIAKSLNVRVRDLVADL